MVYTSDKSSYYATTDGGNTYTPTVSHKDYLKFLPSLNVSWDITDTFKLRGAVAEVIARPRYAQLAGAFSRSDTNLTASTGNPDLDPYQSTNYELSGEWYFRPGSLLSVEYFRREISSYMVTKTVSEFVTAGRHHRAEYQVTKPVNASNATVNGVSVGFQTAIWGGFGILTNYTYANAKSGVDADGNVVNLPYLSKHTVNVIPYFEKDGFQARVSWNWRSDYFTGDRSPELGGQDRWLSPARRLDRVQDQRALHGPGQCPEPARLDLLRLQRHQGGADRVLQEWPRLRCHLAVRLLSRSPSNAHGMSPPLPWAPRNACRKLRSGRRCHVLTPLARNPR
jgi:TonB-dependent receptor